jgi:hypothetical protein
VQGLARDQIDYAAAKEYGFGVTLWVVKTLRPPPDPAAPDRPRRCDRSTFRSSVR